MAVKDVTEESGAFANLSIAEAAGISAPEIRRPSTDVDFMDPFVVWIRAAAAAGQVTERVVTEESGAPRAVFGASPELARVFALAGDGAEAILGVQSNTLAALAPVVWSEARVGNDPAAGWCLRLSAEPYRCEITERGREVRRMVSRHAADLVIPVLSMAVRYFPKHARALSIRRVTLWPDGRPKEIGKTAWRRMPLTILDWPA